MTVAAVLLAAKPAAAQGKVDFSAGYQFLRFLEDPGENVPAGWAASVYGGKSEKIKIVGSISGNYKDGQKLHLFQGGVDVPFGKNANAVPFVRLQTGIGANSGGGDTDTAWVITPEFGARVFGKGNWGGQFSVGFPIMRHDGDTSKTMTLFLGVTCRSKK